MKSATKPIKVVAPGKLILSGEHAVVYGAPALAMAVNRYATATISTERRPQILFDLVDFAHQGKLSFDGLHHLKERIKRKYQKFKRGEYSIRDVLQKPFELAQFAMGLVTQNMTLPNGVKIHVHSTIPIGCGMGSSAATILCVMQAVAHYMQIPLQPESLFTLALDAENMQHGRSSGLDLRVAMQGGCVYMSGETLESRSLPNFNFYLVNTGKPDCSTGQCVEAAASHFKVSPTLVDDFTAVTKAIDTAIHQSDLAQMRIAVRENQQLLTHLGVVPPQVQTFIQDIENGAGSAKICGAGAVSGQKAGVILVITDDASLLSTICKRYNYEILSIVGESRGIHVV